MKHTHSSRGSILLLVVGLLTIVAMLGATFLIIARMNTRQVREASVKNLADPVAAGAVATIAEILRTRLFIGDTGPFAQGFTRSTDATNNAPQYGANSWKMYIDYPDPAIDRFLSPADMPMPYRIYDYTGATPYSANDLVTPYANYDPNVSSYLVNTIVNYASNRYQCSVVNGTASGGAQSPTNPNYWTLLGPTQFFYCMNPLAAGSGATAGPQAPNSNWAQCSQVDTDGDGVVDAYLVPTSVVNSSGDRYFVAVKVTDTCGNLNLNTAVIECFSTNPISPANVDLTQIVGGPSNATGFAGHVTARLAGKQIMSLTGVNTRNMNDYFFNCGQRLLSPVLASSGNYITAGISNDFLPYSMNEELFLGCYTPATLAGLVYWDPTLVPPGEANYSSWYLGGTSVNTHASTSARNAIRQKLTVWSDDRDLPRHPDADIPQRLVQPFLYPAFDSHYSTNTTGHQASYQPGNTVLFCDGPTTNSMPPAHYYTCVAATTASPTASPGSWRFSLPSDLNNTPNDPLNLLYQQTLAMLNSQISDLPTRKYAAANFTANLWYHCDFDKNGYTANSPAAASCWAFTPSTSPPGITPVTLDTFTAFGTTTDLASSWRMFLAEEFFKTDGAITTPKTAMAVELYVATNAPAVPLSIFNSNTYYIKFGTAGVPIALNSSGSNTNKMPTTPARGQRITFVILSGGLSVAGGQITTDGSTNFLTTPIGGIGTNVIDVSNANSTAQISNGPIQLLQLVKVCGKYTFIPIDQIDATKMDFTSQKAGLPNPHSWDMAKDDNTADNRYAVAAAVQVTASPTSGATDAPHSLGAANNTSTTPITANSPGIGTIDVAPTTPILNPIAAAPYPVLLPGTNSITSGTAPMINTVGDLCEVYFCGPITLASLAGADNSSTGYSTVTPPAILAPAYNPTVVPFSARISDVNFAVTFPVNDPVRGRLNLSPGFPVWNSTTNYVIGDKVVYGGTNGTTGVLYVAMAANTGKTPGDTNWALLPGTPPASWPVMANGWTKSGTTLTGYYPDVPGACLLGEFFNPLPPDPTRLDEMRHYGRINVNTATVDAPTYNAGIAYSAGALVVYNQAYYLSLVGSNRGSTPSASSTSWALIPNVLTALPWPTSLSGLTIAYPNQGSWSPLPIRDAAVEFIQAYRDRRVASYTTDSSATPPNVKFTKDYTNRAVNMLNLRGTSNFNGYLTPSEVAIPLADLATLFYTNTSVAGSYANEATFRQQSNYAALRDQFYRPISNCITVRSDTFRANVYVELRGADPITGAWNRTRQSWRYLSVIDRSNCRKASDRPAILLFTEVR
jgi:hypothetical protein